MREEYHLAGLPFQPFHRAETARRVEEYQSADAILCPSLFVKKSFMQEGIASARLLIVPYGISLQPAVPQTSRPTETFRVLYVGQISVRKGLRYLFQAFEKLRHPKKELWIVGPTTKQTGLEGVNPPAQTRFLGELKDGDLAHAYREASVFVLPTVEEGLALVLGEALSFGVPVIATDHSGGEDLFQDGVEGFIVPIRDPRAIAEKLQQFADDPGLREKMSIAAKTRAHLIQGWEDTGRKLIEALSALVAAGKQPSGSV